MKLRPCPFCGSTNTKLDANLPLHELEEFTVRCMNCGISGQWCADAEGAVVLWNHRTSDEYITALEAILATLDPDKDTRDSIDRAIAGLKGE